MKAPGTHPLSRGRPAVAALALPGFVAALLLSACGPHRPAAPVQPRTVSVAPAARADITIAVEYAARVHPKEEIVVSPKVGGRVATVRAEVSQRVRQGQVLFTLESKDYEAQVRQAQASLDSARANLTRTSDSSLSSQVLQARAAVDQAKVQYHDAEDLAGRMDKLYTQGSVSRQQRDDARARADSARIALDAATQNLSLIQEKGGPQATGLASTQVDQAKAALDLAESQLGNTVIVSPIDGVVALRSVDPGELVASRTPAFVIIDTSSLTAEASVDEAMIARIHPGERVPVRADAAGPAPLEGTVQTVSPAADPRTQGFLVKVRISDPPAALMPGMLARVSFPKDHRSGVLTVPNQALVTESGVQRLYLDVNGVVRKVTVQTGLSDESRTEITGGLAEGDLVITDGQSFLNEGDRVTAAK